LIVCTLAVMQGIAKSVLEIGIKKGRRVFTDPAHLDVKRATRSLGRMRQGCLSIRARRRHLVKVAGIPIVGDYIDVTGLLVEAGGSVGSVSRTNLHPNPAVGRNATGWNPAAGGGTGRRGRCRQLPLPQRVPAQRGAGGVRRRHARRLGPAAGEHVAGRRGVPRSGRRAGRSTASHRRRSWSMRSSTG